MRQFMFLLLFLLCVSGKAQTRKGFSLGENIGVGKSTMSRDDFAAKSKGGVVDHDSRLYYSVSVKPGFMFTEHIGIYFGLGFHSYKWSTDLRWGYESHTAEGRITYIGIPLEFRFITSKAGKPGFFVIPGVELMLLDDPKTVFKYYYDNRLLYEESDSDNKNYNNAVVTGYMQFGLSLPVGKGVDMYLGPRIQTQFSNIYSSEPGVTGHLLSGSFNLSFTSRIGK